MSAGNHMSHRTRQQAHADTLDMDLHRIADRLYAHANSFDLVDFKHACGFVERARGLVRNHMHPLDVEATRGS
jgi:hypothetical protein